jgi:hypothetical protein
VGGLLDGEGDGPHHGVRRDRLLPIELLDAHGSFRVGDAERQLRLDRSGRDDGRADPIDLLPNVFGDGAHRVLGRAVHRTAHRDLVTGDRGDVDDVPALLPLEHRKRGARAISPALFTSTSMRPNFSIAACERVALAAFRHVNLHRRGLTSRTLDVGDDRLEPIHAPRAEEHLGALRSQVARGGLTQPAARSRDDDDLSLNVRHASLVPGGSCAVR